MPKKKQRTVRVNGNRVPVCATLDDLRDFDADSLSPEPEQLRGPETWSMATVKRYAMDRRNFPHPWDPVRQITLDRHLKLTHAVATLLYAGVITARLALQLCDSIAGNFRGK